MSDAPETVWLYYAKETDDAQWVDGPETDGLDEYETIGKYRRADLPATDAQAMVKALEERLLDTAASLAAAISLLEHGGKKAAASDKMFAQMLLDYNASLSLARVALAALEKNDE